MMRGRDSGGRVNPAGQREVLVWKVGVSEAEPFWTECLRNLNRRSLRVVKLVICDSHEVASRPRLRTF
jgi:putative transposase